MLSQLPNVFALLAARCVDGYSRVTLGTKKRKEERQRKIRSLGKKSYITGIYVCVNNIVRRGNRVVDVDLSFRSSLSLRFVASHNFHCSLSLSSFLSLPLFISSRNLFFFFPLFFLLKYKRTYLATTWSWCLRESIGTRPPRCSIRMPFPFFLASLHVPREKEKEWESGMGAGSGKGGEGESE